MYILSFRGLDDTVSLLVVASVSLLAQVHQCNSSRGTNIICLAPALGAGESGGHVSALKVLQLKFGIFICPLQRVAGVPRLENA